MEEIKLQVGVKALLQNNERKFLLLKRSDKYKNIEGEWDIVGGRIEPGKTLIENLKREIKEETSLILKEEPHFISAQDILRVEGKHIVRLTFKGKINGEPKLDEENTEFKWVTREELESMENLDCYVKELIKKKII